MGRASAFLQRARLGLPPPPRRARCIECASVVPCLSSRSAGRSPFKVCSSAVDVCFAFLTDFPRGRGRRGRLTSPKTERGAFRLSKLAEKLSRSVFCLRRASPPKLGHCPCGARRASPALVVLRGAAMPRLFDSACHDQIFIAASASRGHFAPYGLGALRLGFPRLPARCISPRFPRRFRVV